MAKNTTTKSDSEGSPLRRVDDPKYWHQEVEAARRYFEEFRRTGARVYARYEQESLASSRVVRSAPPNTNILWANTKLEKPTLYSQTPKPISKVKYSDSDPAARVASKLLETNCCFQVEEKPDFDDSLNDDVQDFQLTGRGITRVRYKPEFGTNIVQIPVLQAPDGSLVDGEGQPVDAEQVQQNDNGELFLESEVPDVITESVIFDHVDFAQFLHAPERTWRKVWWVSFDNYLFKEEVIQQFGAGIANRLSYDREAERESDEQDERAAERESKKQAQKTLVVEIWDKKSRKVRFISPDLPGEFLQVAPDPLGLKDFFPVPKPLINNRSTRSLIGRPDYIYYESMAEKLELIDAKIFKLIDALRCVGVHDQAFHDELKKIFRTRNNVTFPVDWARLTATGGLNSKIELLEMKDVVEQLNQLSLQRQQVMQAIYEMTGQSDLLRGSSDPRETATAASLKGQFGAVRPREKAKEVARYARDLIAIAAEIIAEKFQPSTLKAIAGTDYYPENEQQYVEPAIALLKQDGLRRIKVDIETDSTVAYDEQQQKEEFVEFLNAFTDQINRALPVLQAIPAYKPVFDELMLKSARVYRMGKQFESAIEQAIELQRQQEEQAAQQPPAPDPALIKAQNDYEIAMAKLQADQEKSAAEVAIEAERIRQEFELKRHELNSKVNMKTMDAIMRSASRSTNAATLDRQAPRR